MRILRTVAAIGRLLVLDLLHSLVFDIYIPRHDGANRRTTLEILFVRAYYVYTNRTDDYICIYRMDLFILSFRLEFTVGSAAVVDYFHRLTNQ